MKRLLLVCVVAALAAPVTVVPAAVADPVFPVCGEVESPSVGAPVDPSGVYLCLGGETGVYDPLWGPYCRTADPLAGCRFLVTAGHTGIADVDAQLCTVGAGQQPLCVAVDTGTIPLYRIDPMHVCYGWSPWESPCYYREVDEP